MSVTLTIKNVPDELAAALRAQAARNHRSLQGELMSVLESVVRPATAAPVPSPVAAAAPASVHTQHSSPVTPVSPASSAAPGKDSLLTELDALVAGSSLGAGPWLAREQMHGRPMRINQTLPPQS